MKKHYKLEDLEYKKNKTWAVQNYDMRNIISTTVLRTTNWSEGGKPIKEKMSLRGQSTKIYQGGE